MGGRKTKIIWITVGIVFVLFLLLDIAIIRAGRYMEKETAPQSDHAAHHLSCDENSRVEENNCLTGS